jgi:predicted nucleic acid-binding protein
LYDAWFASAEVFIREIDAAVVDRATEIRAQYGLKTPDAIHAATALLSDSAAFWTTDKNFRKIAALSVELLQVC